MENEASAFNGVEISWDDWIHFLHELGMIRFGLGMSPGGVRMYVHVEGSARMETVAMVSDGGLVGKQSDVEAILKRHDMWMDNPHLMEKYIALKTRRRLTGETTWT